MSTAHESRPNMDAQEGHSALEISRPRQNRMPSSSDGRDEVRRRSPCEHRHRWRIEPCADRLNEIHLARLKAERAELDRIERIKQERIARLLNDAEAFQKAETICTYVASARDRMSANARDEVATWETRSRRDSAGRSRSSLPIGKAGSPHDSVNYIDYGRRAIIASKAARP